jgi:mRNA deadenylase 3'-5' endonuclease subunit Ccr4
MMILRRTTSQVVLPIWRSSRNMSSSSSSVSVVSYNVLSEKLCNWSYFDKSRPSDCDADVRYERVSQKLKTQMDSNAVICMQEVSRRWLEKMIPMFSYSNYAYVSYQGHKMKNGCEYSFFFLSLVSLLHFLLILFLL